MRIKLILYTTLLCALVACKPQTKTAEAKPIEVETIVLEAQTNHLINSYIGNISESENLPLAFALGGKVESIYVHNGNRVSAGDILVKVDNTQQLNALREAGAKLSQAQDAYNRLEKVYQDGAVAEIKWIDIQTQLESAKTLVAAAKKQADDCILRAPQSGVVSGLNIVVGQQLLPNQTVLSLLELTGFDAIFSVPETEIQSISIGDCGTITVPALSDQKFTGKITEKSMIANRLTHTYELKMRIDQKQGLMPGMVGKIELENQSLKGYIIPNHCVHTTTQGPAIWLKKQGKAQRTFISSPVYTAQGILVADALNEGDSIIVSGYQKLYNNAPVVSK